MVRNDSFAGPRRTYFTKSAHILETSKVLSRQLNSMPVFKFFSFHLLDHITTDYTHPFLEQKIGILISKRIPTYRGMTSFGTLLIRVLSLRMVSRHWKARGYRTCVSCTLYRDHTWLSRCSSYSIEPSFRQL